MEKEEKQEDRSRPMSDAELDLAIRQLQELTKKLMAERRARKKKQDEKTP